MQISLLPQPESQTLVDDETGLIVYRRALFGEEQTLEWFDQLRDTVAWRTERRPMYDRVVDVPRLVASYALRDISVPPAVAAIRPTVEQFCGVTFTSAGLNFYRDGNDSVAPHGDHLDETPDRAPVALVSLGGTRRMTIRSRSTPRRILDQDLEAGSLLLMSYESHLNFDHGIPKTKKYVGARISIAFRRTYV